MGSHEELMAIESGIYRTLVALTMRKSDGKETEQESSEEEEIDLNGNDEVLTPVMKRKLSRDVKGSVKGRLKRMVSNVSEADSKISEELTKTEEDSLLESFSISRTMQLNSPEYHWIVIGCIAAAINGASQPAFAIIFSRILEAFSFPDDELKRRSRIYCGMFALIGVVLFVANLIQGAAFGKSGEELTKRARSMSFKAMLRQALPLSPTIQDDIIGKDITWFDDQRNGTGALTSRLATQAANIQGATGVRLGTVFQSVFNMGAALIISFIYGWQLTLLVLALLPLIVVAGAIQWKVVQGNSVANKVAYEGAGKVSSEAIDNVRTIASLAREDTFFDKYSDYLEEPHKSSLAKGLIGGCAFGFSQCVIFFIYAATFLVVRDKMEFEDIFL
ncbi:ATP-dependent translocase ABCB1-like [Antedon mediterranea]|uniref:ATP-dependent translocase ABCB1-like n=1 Tax=Antedon mediterranea TaxID=105859 RepID=UPI003AF93D6F